MGAIAESVWSAARGPQTAAIQPEARQESHSAPRRYYGLDAVRSGMMLLGILYHASLVYYTRAGAGALPGTLTELTLGARSFRVAQTSVALIYMDRGLHIFRMPVFFVIAGFFGALLYARRGASTTTTCSTCGSSTTC